MRHNHHPAQLPVHELMVRTTRCHSLESVLPKAANNITAVAKHVSPSIGAFLASAHGRDEAEEVHTRSTNESTTRFSPARSNAMVSLLPSTTVTLPLPNFW